MVLESATVCRRVRKFARGCERVREAGCGCGRVRACCERVREGCKMVLENVQEYAGRCRQEGERRCRTVQEGTY